MAVWRHKRRACSRYLSAAALLWAAVALGPRPVPAAEAGEATAVLKAHGLEQFHRLWLAPLEIELREELAKLPKRRERIVVLEQDLHERIETNRRAWQSSRPAIAALQKSLAKLGTDDPRRDVLERQIAALEQATPEPARLSARGDVRSRVVAWNRERNALAAALVRIRRAVPQLQQLYDDLVQNRALLAALATLGNEHRLGPLRSYQDEIERLADYERLIYTPWTPVYWQGNHLRFTSLFAERLPITFSWIDSSGEPATLTHTVAEAAGIAIPESAPRESVSLGDGPAITARRVVLPQLRIGKLVLEDVAVLILPPEAEDWGCRLGRGALAGRTVKLEPERLRLWIDAG